jgi:hypothetical protein
MVYNAGVHNRMHCAYWVFHLPPTLDYA